MAEKCLKRLGHHYILAMMVVTRLCGSIGGLLVLYYVNFTLTLPPVIRWHFETMALIVVALAVTLTVWLAMWETRNLRETMRRLQRREPVDEGMATEAGREAVLFAGRHHRHEAWLVPSSTLAPLLVFLKVVDDASMHIMWNISLAAFMATAMALMSTYFLIDHLMRPVVRYLLENKIPIHFDTLPASKLRSRLNLSFALIILITAVMIGTLAKERAADLVANPENQMQAVANLRAHTTYITIAAVASGVTFSTVLARSVAFRVGKLVEAMKRVQQGNLSERLAPTGNDEIDTLTRQFNAMVAQLKENDHTIRDLNANLERKVKRRTQELEVALKELQETQARLLEVAHRAGMSEVATGVLHNVGNVLNSVNISATLVSDRLRSLRLDGLAKAATLLSDHSDHLDQFLAADQQGKKIPRYVTALSSTLLQEREAMLKEVEQLNEKLQHIRGIIASQQNYARRVALREQVELPEFINDILAMHGPSFKKQKIEVVRDFHDIPAATLEKLKLVQVLDNLIKNAVESLAASDGSNRTLTVRVRQHGPDRASIEIADSGEGIAPDDLPRIFTYGFTTKPNGHGFGLHSAANAMGEMGGMIRARSAGAGEGATFTVEFPLVSETNNELSRAPDKEEILANR